jgi:hypothetical protein
MTLQELITDLKAAGANENTLQLAMNCYELGLKNSRNATWTQEHWTEYEHDIAAIEREACAKICEDFADQHSGPDGIWIDYHAHLIRERSKA